MPETNRIWHPIPGTATREFCTVSESVRVVRQRLFITRPGHSWIYEIQEWSGMEWHIRSEETNHQRAFNQARQYARQRQERSVTR